MTFIYYLALAYLAAALIGGGIHHAARLTSFGDIVRSHRIIPARVAMPLTVVVTVFELAAGSVALVVLFREEIAPRASLLFSICTAIGLVFALYVRQLLRSPAGISSCGCSSFASPLTTASIVPALALVLVSLSGLVTTALGFRNTLNSGFVVVLPLVWGVTLATIINLVPASMAAPDA